MAKIMLKVAVPPNTILNTINAKDQIIDFDPIFAEKAPRNVPMEFRMTPPQVAT
ncbi:hypothetical protein JHK87_050536 [Glycine soja]|nr:hypothetical protein JHK87_050536 [Glycine soja]